MKESSKDQGAIEWLESERLVEGFFTVDAIMLRHELIAGGMTPPSSDFYFGARMRFVRSWSIRTGR
jgi:hypothetical protein